MPALIYLSIFLLAAAGVLLLWRSTRARRETGLPTGRVVYADTRSWGRVEEPLYDSFYDLTGKPDYVVRQDGAWIPVEVKSSHAPTQPYRSHIYQLAAYCLLIERTRNVRPPYGILHYRDGTFAIDYSDTLRGELIGLLGQMRASEKQHNGPARSHKQAARCSG